MLTRKRLAMVMAEFLGTALLTTAILAISKSGLGHPYFIASTAALVIAMGVLTFSTVSGAHFNPIVTIGLWSIRRVKTLPTVVYVSAQFLGAFAAYYLYKYLTTQEVQTVTEFDGRILVAEAVGALVFSLGWAAAVYQRMNIARSAAVIGLSFMIGMVISAVGGGGIVNPAVALGAQTWEWGTYVLGPVLGAIIGFNLYSLLFAPASELTERAEAAAAETTDVVAEEKPAKPKAAKKK